LDNGVNASAGGRLPFIERLAGATDEIVTLDIRGAEIRRSAFRKTNEDRPQRAARVYRHHVFQLAGE
jgi:hypothetical protein